MSQDMLKLMQTLMELGVNVGELKGEREALRKEIEYLRGLLADKLAEQDKDEQEK